MKGFSRVFAVSVSGIHENCGGRRRIRAFRNQRKKLERFGEESLKNLSLDPSGNRHQVRHHQPGEYVTAGGGAGGRETYDFHHHQPPPPQDSLQTHYFPHETHQTLFFSEPHLSPAADEPTLAPPAKKRNAGGSSRAAGLGEIVEVQGGHIVRSTGRKDRHSKVCTAKGPRDRRVRLAAHTAIQFYDVQDRLGFDRPSKAVDWLITKAKSAIDQLDHLPPWKPTAKTKTAGDGDGETSSNLPHPSLTSGDIPAQFSGGHSQDLKLSLQSFQDPILHSQIGFESMFMAPQMYGHGGHFFSQRGPLQSSNSPAIRAWTGDNGVGSSAGHDYQQGISLAGIGYANSGGYSGFHIPARIQGDDEDHDDGNHNNPSSASSGSRH